MNEEIDESDYFQQDFTTASDWELFNSRLEEVFHTWKLHLVDKKPSKILEKDELFKCEWSVQKELLNFADCSLEVSHYRAKVGQSESESDGTSKTFRELLSLNNTFCPQDYRRSLSPFRIHPVAVWYGLTEFVIISPVHMIIKNESQIRILQSSVHLSVAESNCQVPVFIQVLDKRMDVYLGVCEADSMRVSFDVINLQQLPSTYKNLSGLLEMFKGKIGVQYVDPVTVSVRTTYSVEKIRQFVYECPIFDYDKGLDIICELPFGLSSDPVIGLTLMCTWPQVRENVVIDTRGNSNFDPFLAPEWAIRCNFDDSAISQMSEILNEFLASVKSKTTLVDILGENSVLDAASQGRNPLELLTESRTLKLPKLLRSGPSGDKKSFYEPIPEDVLKRMLAYLFPESQEDTDLLYYFAEEPFDHLKMKTAPENSIIHRLAILLSIANVYFEGHHGMAQLWVEFVIDMRYRVDRCVEIPGVAGGFPDTRTCLLHQKLQMLNVCMERRKLREGGLPFSMSRKTRKSPEDEDSDDEFYDCPQASDEDEEKTLPFKPEGRLSKLENTTLVDSDEPLYIPHTQDVVIKTEDELQDDADIMLKLGPGSELGTQMMSASLLSDMESFKAANPNGKLEDFIRWYSPRDWIEEEEEKQGGGDEKEEIGDSAEVDRKVKGHLSARMLIPGNTWQTVWSTAKPVAARKQKRLFDDTKEAEKVLHFFETRSIGQIVELTMATLAHVAFKKLQENGQFYGNVVPNFKEKMEKVQHICCKLSRDGVWKEQLQAEQMGLTSDLPMEKKWELVVNELADLEDDLTRAKSLHMKLFPKEVESPDELGFTMTEQSEALIRQIMNGFAANLEYGPNGEVAKQVLSFFHDPQAISSSSGESEKDLSLFETEREYVLRVSGKTQRLDDGGPQFLRVISAPNGFHLCGAFTQNVNIY